MNLSNDSFIADLPKKQDVICTLMNWRFIQLRHLLDDWCRNGFGTLLQNLKRRVSGLNCCRPLHFSKHASKVKNLAVRDGYHQALQMCLRKCASQQAARLQNLWRVLFPGFSTWHEVSLCRYTLVRQILQLWVRYPCQHILRKYCCSRLNGCSFLRTFSICHIWSKDCHCCEGHGPLVSKSAIWSVDLKFDEHGIV